MTSYGDENHAELLQALLQSTLHLPAHIEFYTQVHRSVAWVVIKNPLKNQHFKTTYHVKDLLQKLDGKKTLKTILQENPSLNAKFQEDESYLVLLAKLIEAAVVQSDLPIDFQQEISQEQKKQKEKAIMAWTKPWFVRLPLLNPNGFLASVNRKLSFLWSKPVFVLWLCVVGGACVVAAESWTALTQYWHQRFLDPVNLVLVFFIYPILKMLHEMAHGLSTKKWGGAVHEAGLAFLFFVPVPYVDASASTVFPNKKHRIVVSSAGIMVELLLASLALFVWNGSDVTLVRDVCFNIMLIGAVSSLFFNGNPLLKYDGYYILSDLIEVPNLGSRSKQYWSYLFDTYILRIKPNPKFVFHKSERLWLFFYGLLSSFYRLFISVAIALFIAGKYFFIGAALGVWALASQVVYPAARWFYVTYKKSRVRQVLVVYLASVGAVSFLLFLVLFVVPFDRNSVLQGVMIMDGSANIKAGVDGEVLAVLVRQHDYVTAGQPIARLNNNKLEKKIALTQAKVEEMALLVGHSMANDKSQVQWYQDQLNDLKKELEELSLEKSHLILKAPLSGRVELAGLKQLNGKYVKKGDALGAILGESVQGILVVPEYQASILSENTQAVYIRFNNGITQPLASSDVQFVPQAETQLPTKFLGSLFGGGTPVDVSDPDGVKSLKPIFVIELNIRGIDTAKVGARMHVKFVHDRSPLGHRIYSYLYRYVEAQLKPV